MLRLLGLTTGLLLTLPLLADGDAWPLYQKAAQHIREGDKLGKSSPAASSLEYKGYPPFSVEWVKLAKAAYEANGPAFDLVHQAAAIENAHWPVINAAGQVDLSWLSEVRNLANEVGDAALWEHVQGNDAAAFARLNDLWHLADLLDRVPNELRVQALVANGVRMLTANRLEVINTELHLSREKDGSGKEVSVAEARSFIKRLYNGKAVGGRVNEVWAREAAFIAAEPQKAAEAKARFDRTQARTQSEANLVAAALACQVVKFEKGRWPKDVAEIAAELPESPKDAFGPIGYVIVKGPTGAEPLVYSRGEAAAADLVYPTDEPLYGFYPGKAVGLANKPAPGQFRDVSLWQETGKEGGAAKLK